MIYFLQILFHLVGDYVTQSDWMANNKTKSTVAAAAHALVYSSLFLLLDISLVAFAVILVTHFFIDRFRLARYVVWIKNLVFKPCGCPPELVSVKSPSDCADVHSVEITEEIPKYSWRNCSNTGYPDQTPPWLAVWLLIVADNTLHLAINFLAIQYL